MSSEAPVQTFERVTDEPGTPASTPAPTAAPVSTDPMEGVRSALQNAFAPKPAPAPEPAAPEPTAPVVVTPEPAVATAPEVAPEVAPEPVPEVRGMAKLYELAQLPPDQAFSQAVDVIKADAQYDPIAFGLARESMYQVNQAVYRNWALEDLGVPADKVNEFVTWAKQGAQALPAPAQLPSFPEPDADDIVTLPNGTQLDLSDPVQAELYETKKWQYEQITAQQQREAVEARARSESEAEERRNQERAQAQLIEQRGRDFGQQRVKPLVDAIETMLPQFTEDTAFFKPLLLKAIFSTLMEQENAVDERGNPATELARLSRAARPYVDADAGRKDEYGRKIDQIYKVEAQKVIDQFNRFFVKANKAEIAAAVTAPVLPEGTRTVTVQTPAAPNTKPPQNRDEVFSQMRQQVSNIDWSTQLPR